MHHKQIIANQDNLEKLRLAVERALPKLPRDLREKVRSMLTPEALATLTVIAALGIGSHWIGIGEVVDVVLIGWGVWTLGPEALNVGRDLHQFVTVATHAQNDRDIDRAADHFAHAVTIIGVDGLAAIVLHKAFKAVRGLKAGRTETTAGPSRILDEDTAHRLAVTPGIQDVLGDLTRGKNKAQGAEYLLDRAATLSRDQKIARLEDEFGKKQGVDMVLENGDVVQAKSYSRWSDVERDILGSIGDITSDTSKPKIGQAQNDARRYGSAWRSGKDDIRLSGRFEFHVDGEALLKNGEGSRAELEAKAAELENFLNSAYSQDMPDGKPTAYSVTVTFKDTP